MKKRKLDPFEKSITLDTDPESGETIMRVSMFGPVCGVNTKASFERRVPDAVRKLDSAERMLDGMAKGPATRFGPTEERQGKVRAFLADHRAQYARLSNNAMIREAVKQCGPSESTIRRWIRIGKLSIPPKT